MTSVPAKSLRPACIASSFRSLDHCMLAGYTVPEERGMLPGKGVTRDEACERRGRHARFTHEFEGGGQDVIEPPEDRSYLVQLGDGLLRLTFSRPEHGNAIPSTAVPQLTALFRTAKADASVRCILIEGKGKVFSAGGDVAGFSRSLEQDVATRQADFARRMDLLSGLIEAVAAFDRPVVVGVRGAAAGAALVYPLIADY